MINFLMLNFLAIITVATGGYNSAREEAKGTLLWLVAVSLLAVKILAEMM